MTRVGDMSHKLHSEVAQLPATQGSMFEVNPPDGPGETSTDSYCTPEEVCWCIRASVNGCSVGDLYNLPTEEGVRTALDPWTNTRAIAHGWVGATTAWTLASGRDPDMAIDPRPWPIEPGDYVHGNPPYSRSNKYVERYLLELKRAQAWGGLVMNTDNRTEWWRTIMAHHPFICLWDGYMNFFHIGERIKGNNKPNCILVVDHTGMDRTRRYEQLQRAYDGRAWVYR